MKASTKIHYNRKAKNIEKLLSEIQNGLVSHKLSTNGLPHWGHVGDLDNYEEKLQDIRDALLHEGEYAD